MEIDGLSRKLPKRTTTTKPMSMTVFFRLNKFNNDGKTLNYEKLFLNIICEG